MNTATVSKKNNKTLWLMLAVGVLPIVAAYTAFFTGIGVPSTTVNAGKLLLEVQSIQPLVGADTIQSFEEDKRWRLLLPIVGECGEQCERNLYTSRQVHIRLDQKSKRLTRIALVVDNALSASEIAEYQQAHPRLLFIAASLGQWQSWSSMFDENVLNGGDAYFLVDQEHRAMMAYDSAIHGNDVLKDIKRALKFSIDYQ